MDPARTARNGFPYRIGFDVCTRMDSSTFRQFLAPGDVALVSVRVRPDKTYSLAADHLYPVGPNASHWEAAIRLGWTP